MRPLTPEDILLDHLPKQKILGMLSKGAGRELDAKFLSPASSAALACSAFGLFVDRPGLLPPLPGTQHLSWPAMRVAVEEIVRFPWRGGRHPHLDAVVETSEALIGVEAKRFEPFRDTPVPEFSDAYFRPVWREDTRPWQAVRDGLVSGALAFRHLDAAQLVKHAFGLSTQAARQSKAAALIYLFHEPTRYPDGRPIPPALHVAHRDEVRRLAGLVEGGLRFSACTYAELLSDWAAAPVDTLRRHAAEVMRAFAIPAASLP